MYLYGAGGHCKVIIEILELSNVSVTSVVDDNPKSSKILEYVVQSSIEMNFDESREFIVAIGDNRVRKKVSSRLNVSFVKAIHPSANISRRVLIGEGTVVLAASVVNCDSIIGKHCIINTSSSIDHDCRIGDFVHIAPAAALAGNVSVGEGAFIGIGSVIVPGIQIGKWAIIGAGAVIVKDVPDFAVVVGNPGTIIKYNDKF